MMRSGEAQTHKNSGNTLAWIRVYAGDEDNDGVMVLQGSSGYIEQRHSIREV